MKRPSQGGSMKGAGGGVEDIWQGWELLAGQGGSRERERERTKEEDWWICWWGEEGWPTGDGGRLRWRGRWWWRWEKGRWTRGRYPHGDRPTQHPPQTPCLRQLIYLISPIKLREVYTLFLSGNCATSRVLATVAKSSHVFRLALSPCSIFPFPLLPFFLPPSRFISLRMEVAWVLFHFFFFFLFFFWLFRDF